VHIATHGLRRGSSAWDSTISLGEKSSVVDIARLHSQASLVCFAACVSGLGEDNIGNDLLGFSHAVIASGASTFLGGLWEVEDLATMILMIFFHRAVKEQKTDVSLAACWRQAQVRLYELTKPELRVLLEELVTAWDKAVYDGRSPPGISLQPRAAIRNILEDDDECDFTHPFYWAAFVLVGHGGLMLCH
jgi:CHAT domain-containing protein